MPHQLKFKQRVMITETHQCPLCLRILTQGEVDYCKCLGCGATEIPKHINTMPDNDDTVTEMDRLKQSIDRMDIHFLTGYNGGFGHYL